MGAHRVLQPGIVRRRRIAGTARLILPIIVGAALIVGVSVFILAPLMPPQKQAVAVATPSASASPSPSQTAPPALGALNSKLGVRVLFGTETVGAKIASGVTGAYRSAGVPSPRVSEWKTVKNGKGPVFASARVGRDGDPRSRLRDFAAMVNDAPTGSIDVALIEFGYADITADSDVGEIFSQYSATMQALERAHPDVDFLYTTVPVTTENGWKPLAASKITGLVGATQPVWQHNIARERYNALVRDTYGSTGRLFDIAALESRISKDTVAAKEHEARWFYVMNPALSSDGRRPNATGSKQLATGLLRLIAAVSTH